MREELVVFSIKGALFFISGGTEKVHFLKSLGVDHVVDLGFEERYPKCEEP
jgi:hypothetical protein